MRGGKNTPTQKQVRVNRAFWADSEIVDPQIVSGMPPERKTIGQIKNPLYGSQMFANIRF